MKKLILLFSAIFFIGCGSNQLSPHSLKKELKKEHKEYSHWFLDQSERVPLKIVVLGYVDPEVKYTKEYKRYINLFKQIKKNPTILNKITNSNFTDKFWPIKVVNFDSKEIYLQKFVAVYKNRFEDKEVLNDILRPDVEKPSAEILIRLNYQDLKKGKLTLEGYKTIKTPNYTRNSFYYYLIKPDYSLLPPLKQKETIINSVSAVLKLSIPQYVSLELKNLIKTHPVMKIFTKKDENFIFKGYIKKHIIWNEITPKQLLYTKPLPYEDLKTLYDTKYIPFEKKSDLSLKEINELTKVLNTSLIDPLILYGYNDTDTLNLPSKKYNDFLIIYPKKTYDLDEIYFTSNNQLQQNGYKLIYKNSKFTQQDLDTKFGFKVVNYILSFKNPSKAKLNNVYVQIKDSKVTRLSATKIPYGVIKFDLTHYQKDTFLYSYHNYRYLYKAKFGGCTRILFLFKASYDPICYSQFSTRVGIGLGFMDLLFWTITYGIGAGTYFVSYDKDTMIKAIKNSGFRDLEIFKTELK